MKRSDGFSCPDKVQRHIHPPLGRAELLETLPFRLGGIPELDHPGVVFLGSESAPGGIRERQLQRSEFGVHHWHLSLLLLEGVLRGGSGGGRAIADGHDDLVNVDLAERASLPQPGLHFLAYPRILTVGFPRLVQQTDRRTNGWRIAGDIACDRNIFCEEPPAGLDEPNYAFEGTFGIRKLRVCVRLKCSERFESGKAARGHTCRRTRRTWTTSKVPGSQRSGSAVMSSCWN